MTTYETLSLLISIGGAIGVIVSLWLLNRQTTVFRNQLTESISQSVTDYSLEVSRIFLQNPDLRPYFFGGQTIDESHPDYLRAEAVAEVILDIFWTMRTQAQRIKSAQFASNEARSIWAIYVGDCFALSPILTSFLTRRKEWYGQELVDLMEEGLARARKQAAS